MLGSAILTEGPLNPGSSATVFRLPPKAMQASALVLEMTGMVVGGLLAGAWLDGRLGTAPILLALLPFLGMVGGIWRIVRVLEHRAPPEDEP
jgi:F0F1-type ATP synthase assembly protein I